jgi:hypothetical protein
MKKQALINILKIIRQIVICPFPTVNHIRTSFIKTPNLAGEAVTRTPAFSKAATLSSARPFPPEIIAPACPILIH